MPFEPPKHAPHVGVETIAPASTNTSSRPSSARLAPDRLRRRDDDHPRPRVDTAAARESTPPAGGRSSSRSRSCRCRPGRPEPGRPPTPASRCRAGAAAQRAARAPTGRSRDAAGRSASASERSAVHGAPCTTLEVRRHRLVGGEDAGLRAGLDRHVRDGEPLVDRERLRARDRRTRARRSSRRRRRSAPMTARITSLPVTKRPGRPVSSTRIVSGTACQNEPSARHEAMSVEPSPVPNAPRAPYVQVWESPPAIDRAGHDPALLAEERVLDAAAALAVERDALLLRPPLQARLQLGRPHVLRGHEVVGDHDDRGRVEDALGAHLLHRPERDGPGDVVRHDDVAADHDDVAGPHIVRVAVREQDLLSERVRQPTPPVPRGTRRATRRRRTSGRCRRGSASWAAGLRSPTASRGTTGR